MLQQHARCSTCNKQILYELIKDNIFKKTPNTVTKKYNVFCLESVMGVIYVSNKSPHFVSDHIRVRGRKNSQYPLGTGQLQYHITTL